MAVVRKLMRLRHYSIHTERAYCDWIKCYRQGHSNGDFSIGEVGGDLFLTYFATTLEPNESLIEVYFLLWPIFDAI